MSHKPNCDCGNPGEWETDTAWQKICEHHNQLIDTYHDLKAFISHKNLWQEFESFQNSEESNFR